MPGAPTAAGPREESILVHGPDGFAVSALAVALARRTRRSFAWADCADPRTNGASALRSWVEDRSGRPTLEVVDASVLRPANLDRLMLRRLVAAEGVADETRLLNYLALPGLFQRLAARALSSDGRGVMYLANVDALAPELLTNTLETERLHQTLHEEGLTVIVSSRAAPSEALSRPFDRVLHVDVPGGVPWGAGWLTEEKGDGHGGDEQRVPLRTAWDRLGLDPSLLLLP